MEDSLSTWLLKHFHQNHREPLLKNIKPQHETETRIYETRDPIGPFARRVSFRISAL